MSTRCAAYARFIVPCTILLGAGCSGAGPIEEYAKSFTLNGRPSVHIHAADARVSIVTTEEPRVDFKVRYEKEDGSESALTVTSRQDGNVVDLTANEEPGSWWSWNRFTGHQVSIEVRMPKDADLQVETSNGAIEASALAGNIVLHSSNGPIRATQLAGTIDIGSSNGPITLTDIKGRLKAHSSNGRIQATGRFASLDVHSSNGGVVIRAESGSTMAAGWSIRTSNAAIELSVPTDLRADFDANTSNGGIQLELPVTLQGDQVGSHLHGSLNGGGPQVSLQTSNGRIRVTG